MSTGLNDEVSTDLNKEFDEILLRCAELVRSPPVHQKPAMTRFIAAAWKFRKCPPSIEDLMGTRSMDERLPQILRGMLDDLEKEGLGTLKYPNAFPTRRLEFKRILDRVLGERRLGALSDEWYLKEHFGLKGLIDDAYKSQRPVPDLNGDWSYICTTEGPVEKAKKAHGGIFTITQAPGEREWILTGRRTWMGDEKFEDSEHKLWNTNWGRLFGSQGHEIIRYAYPIRVGDHRIEGYGESKQIIIDGSGKVEKAYGEFWHHPQVDPRWGTFVFRKRAADESMHWGYKDREPLNERIILASPPKSAEGIGKVNA